MKNLHTEDGFTLIELMIVVAILAVLSAVAIVAYTKWIRSAREAEAQSILSDIRIKQEAYRASFREYAESGLTGPAWSPNNSKPDSAAINWTSTANANVSSAWAQLGLTPSGKHFYFRYIIEAGAPGDVPVVFVDRNIPNASDFWFGARAVGDLDEDGECEGFEIYSASDLIHRVDTVACP